VQNFFGVQQAARFLTGFAGIERFLDIDKKSCETATTYFESFVRPKNVLNFYK